MEEILELENRHAWPEAISLFCGMFNRLHDRLPQEKLTEEDYQLLTDDEYNELKGCLGEVVELMSRDKESFWRSYDNRKFPARDKDLTDKYHNDTSILALQIALKEPMDKLYNISAKVHRLKQAADEAAAKVADEVARKEKLVIDNEICGMAYRLLQGITPRGERLAEDLFTEGLFDGKHFLLSPSTMRWFKEEVSYPGRIISRESIEAWQEKGSTTAEQRAKEEVTRILATHEPEPLDPDIDKELLGIITKSAQRYGMDKLPLP